MWLGDDHQEPDSEDESIDPSEDERQDNFAKQRRKRACQRSMWTVFQ